MSVGIYPVFNPRVRGVVFGRDGKSLARAVHSLDAIARAGGLTPLSGFMDNRPVPEEFDGDPDELGELLGPWEEWFPIAEGIRTVEGMLTAITSTVGNAEIVDELEGLASCLHAAGSGATLFRLELG
jgi:hypothetical protein